MQRKNRILPLSSGFKTWRIVNHLVLRRKSSFLIKKAEDADPDGFKGLVS
jgi:hypothetical protein